MDLRENIKEMATSVTQYSCLSTRALAELCRLELARQPDRRDERIEHLRRDINRARNLIQNNQFETATVLLIKSLAADDAIAKGGV